MFFNELTVWPASSDYLVTNGVCDFDRRIRSVDQRLIRRVARPRCSTGEIDDSNTGILASPVQHSREENRIRLGEIGIPQNEDIGTLDVVIAANGAVEAEGFLEPDHCTRGMKAGTGLDVVRSQSTLEELRCNVCIRDRPLRRAVHCNAVLSILPDGFANSLGNGVESLCHWHRRKRAASPHHCARDPVTAIKR